MQTLIELNLGGINLGNQGTKDIVHALQNNKVNCIFKKLDQYNFHFVF